MGYYYRAAYEVRRYLSWIEGLTTNQYVGGSNPSGRTTFELVKTLLMQGFLFKHQPVFVLQPLAMLSTRTHITTGTDCFDQGSRDVISVFSIKTRNIHHIGWLQ